MSFQLEQRDELHQDQQQQLPVETLWQMGVRGFEICTQAGNTTTTNSMAAFDAKMAESLASQKFQVAEEAITPTGTNSPQNFGQAFEKLYTLLTTKGSENECLIYTYDGKEKCFIVNHFSDYVIVYSAEDAPTTEGDGMWIVWVILIILIILICVITYYIYKKRKSRENEA